VIISRLAAITALTTVAREFATWMLAVPAVFALACFSWHCVEKPILSLRKKFSFVARARGVDVIY
jgi:peptidoglycan/LPS O-acetylase OafA/YrhL